MAEQCTVSIGLPVYNGENFLALAIESILAQTFSNFELIISDNASTDSTPDICRHYAARDRRISFYRNSSNEGAAANFRKVFYLSRGKYFKWAAHDDLLASEYLQKCLAVLEKRSDIVLCHARTVVIDETGDVIRSEVAGDSRFVSPHPAQRFAALILNDLDDYEIFGIIRKDVLQTTPLIAGFVASDRILRAELGLRGKVYLVDQPLFYSRDHSRRSIRIMPAHHMRGQWFDPAGNKRLLFPHWRILAEYCKCIGRAGLAYAERIKCFIILMKWMTVNMNWARLLADPIIVLFPSMSGYLQRVGSSMSKNVKNGVS